MSENIVFSYFVILPPNFGYANHSRSHHFCFARLFQAFGGNKKCIWICWADLFINGSFNICWIWGKILSFTIKFYPPPPLFITAQLFLFSNEFSRFRCPAHIRRMPHYELRMSTAEWLKLAFIDSIQNKDFFWEQYIWRKRQKKWRRSLADGVDWWFSEFLHNCL